jgi:hypothetical protein
LTKPESQLNLLGKYFVHGILFSILGLVLGFVWLGILIVLVVLGSIIGLVIGFVVLFFFMGGLNSMLTGFIWHVSIKTDWKTVLVHGLVLSIAFLIVHIPSIVISLAAPSIITVVVLFITYAFVDGFVARRVASLWQMAETPLEMVGETPKAFLTSCVKCGKDIPIAAETCPYCGAGQKENLQ